MLPPNWLEDLSLKVIYQAATKDRLTVFVLWERRKIEEFFSGWYQPVDRVLGIFSWIFLLLFRIFLPYFYLRIEIITLLKIKLFFKVLNVVQQIHDKWFFGKCHLKCHNIITFVSRLKKMATMKKFSFLNEVSLLFDWTQGKYFVVFAVMQDEERALLNYFSHPFVAAMWDM